MSVDTTRSRVFDDNSYKESIKEYKDNLNDENEPLNVKELKNVYVNAVEISEFCLEDYQKTPSAKSKIVCLELLKKTSFVCEKVLDQLNSLGNKITGRIEHREIPEATKEELEQLKKIQEINDVSEDYFPDRKFVYENFDFKTFLQKAKKQLKEQTLSIEQLLELHQKAKNVSEYSLEDYQETKSAKNRLCCLKFFMKAENISRIVNRDLTKLREKTINEIIHREAPKADEKELSLLERTRYINIFTNLLLTSIKQIKV